MANPYYRDAPAPSREPIPSASAAPPTLSGGRYDPALEGRKLYIGGIATTGIDVDIVRYDFGRFGEIEDCFVPADRNEPGKIRGIAFVTYKDEATARFAIQEMHGRNYHGREITVNIAKPRGPDPKKDGTFQANTDRYGGKYDAGGRLRVEYRGTADDPDMYGRSLAADPSRDTRYDRDEGKTDGERERDYQQNLHSHGNSYDGTGRYGDRDPRPQQAYYD